jgi:hypothetical protein
MIMDIRNYKLLSMKKIFLNIGLIPGLFAMLILNACKDNITPVVDELTFDRAFTPIGLSAQISNITTVTLTWSEVKNTDHYIVEIYEGTDFTGTALLHTEEIAGDLNSYSYVLPAGDSQFSARLKSVSALQGVTDSKWASVEFKSSQENLFTGYASEMAAGLSCHSSSVCQRNKSDFLSSCCR